MGSSGMAVVASSYLPKTCFTPKIPKTCSSRSDIKFISSPTPPTHTTPLHLLSCIIGNPKTQTALLGVGLLLTFTGSASSAELHLQEPSNALSLPTWAIHVSSVLEWISAMALVWQYGDKSGYQSWKGLSWGMVPLLGGALCACTWHFFYNSESLEVLVALQAALTVIGNATMCIAAYRIYKSREGSKNF